MKIKGMIASTAIILALTTSTAFAIPGEMAPKNGESQMSQKDRCKRHEEFKKDPVKALESKKEVILQLLKEGKLTKEKADEIINRIDSKLVEIKEFEKLPIAEKKVKLIKGCETRLNEMVKDGEVDQKEAEVLFKDFVEKIDKWDGTGYPIFHGKGMKEKHR